MQKIFNVMRRLSKATAEDFGQELTEETERRYKFRRKCAIFGDSNAEKAIIFSVFSASFAPLREHQAKYFSFSPLAPLKFFCFRFCGVAYLRLRCAIFQIHLFSKKLFHHEEHEGHEVLKKPIWVVFLRALRVLRGENSVAAGRIGPWRVILRKAGS